MNWNKQLAKVKHEVRKTMFLATHLLNVNGWKIAMVVLIGLIILRKDISLQLNLKSPTQPRRTLPTTITDNGQAELTSQSVPLSGINSIPVHKNAGKKSKPTTKVPSNATQYSNLGFVLNPNYAKRNNVDPKIVAYKNQICMDYVSRFASVAVTEMKKYGIPASITLAQGLLESNAGQSKLAINNKNHFGIKCFSTNCKNGHCSNHSDDSHKDFFRNYDSVWASFRAHSLFLQRNRYQHLLKLSSTDYKSWARGLSKAGYATDKKYASKLIKLIDNLKLYQYDK